jgi:uncharacterized membrane protein YfcA
VEYAVAVVIVAAAALVRGAAGFGFATVAAPALAFIWPPVFGTSLVLVLDMAATAMIMRSGALAHVRRDDALRLCGAAFFGVIAGVLLLKNLPEHGARLGLDITVLLSAAAALLKIRFRALDHPFAAMAAGFLVGAMIGAFAIGGSLLLAWLMAVDRSPKEMRALMTVVFAFADTLALITRIALGVFPFETLKTSLVLAPVMILGILGGSLVFHRMPAEIWRRGVAVLLIVVAAASLANTIFLT